MAILLGLRHLLLFQNETLLVNRMFFGRIPSLTIGDPEAMRQFLVKDFDNYINRSVCGTSQCHDDDISL